LEAFQIWYIGEMTQKETFIVYFVDCAAFGDSIYNNDGAEGQDWLLQHCKRSGSHAAEALVSPIGVVLTKAFHAGEPALFHL
jgi:hypothetical protein